MITLHLLVYCADSKSKSAETRVIRPGITLKSETIAIGEQTIRFADNSEHNDLTDRFPLLLFLTHASFPFLSLTGTTQQT